MTFVEVMIATAIGGIILAAAGSLMVYNARTLAALTNYADLDRYSRGAVDKLSQDIRQAIPFNTSNSNQSSRIYAIPPPAGGGGMLGSAGGTLATRGP